MRMIGSAAKGHPAVLVKYLLDAEFSDSLSIYMNVIVQLSKHPGLDIERFSRILIISRC